MATYIERIPTSAIQKNIRCVICRDDEDKPTDFQWVGHDNKHFMHEICLKIWKNSGKERKNCLICMKTLDFSHVESKFEVIINRLRTLKATKTTKGIATIASLFTGHVGGITAGAIAGILAVGLNLNEEERMPQIDIIQEQAVEALTGSSIIVQTASLIAGGILGVMAGGLYGAAAGAIFGTGEGIAAAAFQGAIYGAQTNIIVGTVALTLSPRRLELAKTISGALMLAAVGSPGAGAALFTLKTAEKGWDKLMNIFRN